MRLLLIALLTCQLAAAPSYVKRGYVVGETLYEEVGAEVVYHDDVEDWRDRVDTAGGSVSTSTLEALDAFADAIETAGIRDKFYRLNVFAGDDLTTALVPFYVGPVTGGTEYGYQYDQNNGPFGSGDWAESSGLTGDGVAKYLDTGLPLNALDTRHGFGVELMSEGGASSHLMGSWGSTSTTRCNFEVSAGSILHRLGGGTVGSTFGAGFWYGQREADFEKYLYKDGVSVAGPGSSSLTLHANTWLVFATNFDGTANSFAAETLGGYVIADDMTAVQVGNLGTAWTTLQTALSR
jgi:hypothetical protein